MIIERAVIIDMEEILALQKLAYRSEAEIYNDFSIPPLLQTLEEIKEEFRDQVFLKAIVNGKIIGSVRAYQNEEACYIGKLIIEPESQNQGIGTRLLYEIEGAFKLSKRYKLFTGHKSVKNICLYQKAGYKVYKQEKITDNINFVYLEKINHCESENL